MIFTFPLFTIVLSRLILKEAISPGVVMGTVLIVLGVLVLSREKASGSEKNPKLGMLFTLMAAVCYAFSIIASRTGLYHVEPLWGGFHQPAHSHDNYVCPLFSGQVTCCCLKAG